MNLEPLRSALARSASVKTMVALPLRDLAVRFEPFRSALVRSAAVRSRMASPFVMLMALTSKPLRSALMRLASLKLIVASPFSTALASFEPLRSAWARLALDRSMREAS